MSNDLQEINASFEMLPDLTGQGVPAHVAAAAWLSLMGHEKRYINAAIRAYFVTNETVSFSAKSYRKAVALLAPVYAQTQGVPAAIAALVAIARDPKAPAGARVQAANSILDRTGYTEKAADSASKDKLLRELSRDELQARIDSLEREAAENAKDVTAPMAEREDNQLADLIGEDTA